MAQAKKGTSAFTVRSHEVNYRGEATMPAIVGYFQEAAWHNTKTLGISMYDLLERDIVPLFYDRAENGVPVLR